MTQLLDNPALHMPTDTVALPQPMTEATQLLKVRLQRWVAAYGTDDLSACLEAMATDGVLVATLAWWQQGWLPTVLGLLGFPAERLQPGQEWFPGGYRLACGLLGLVSPPPHGCLALRQPPTIHSLLLHGFHFLAARAGLPGYSRTEQQSLANYLAWQQTGDPLPQLAQQPADFLRRLQPALAREMEGLLVLQQLCEGPLHEAYEISQRHTTGHA